jgi:hypothetical protein
MTDMWTRRAALSGVMATGGLMLMPGQAAASLLDGLGLTKLLGNASDSALTKLALPDGFYRDTAIRILLPGTTGKLARRLMQGGEKLGLTTKLTKSLNDAASLAAGEAKPVFRIAISGLKITDVPGIVATKTGGTNYLERTAGVELGTKVRPLIVTALTKVGAFDQLAKLGSAGSLLGALGLSNDKLTDSVTQQAMKGIFTYMGSKEAALRGNPGKILGKVL